MKFFYSSMYVREEINNIEDLVNKVDKSAIQLILDTNICIYLKDFYREPSKIVYNKDKLLWNELKTLLKHIKQYNLEVDYSLGVEESCRNLNNFEINIEKLHETLNHLKKLFEMDFIQMLEHSKLIRFSEPVKDTSKRQSSKVESLEKRSSFQNLLFLSYASLLKLYLLYKDSKEPSKVKKMINYLDFLSNEIDVISLAHVIYGSLLLSGNTKAKDLIHYKKKSIEHVIHALWNASIDLTFPTLVSAKAISDNKIPVFVTADEILWLIFDSMKIKFMFTNGNKSVHPPFIELDFSKTNWSLSELREINNHYDNIQEKRLYKFITPTETMEERINRLRNLCYTLEKDVIEYLDKNLKRT